MNRIAANGVMMIDLSLKPALLNSSAGH